jgi:lysozyme family protein
MARMQPWYDEMWKSEGIWSDDPNDPGGETYRGIAHRWHGRDVIWVMIKEYVDHPNFPDVLDGDASIRARHLEFARENYWGKIRGDDYDERASLLANIVCDTRYNMGVEWQREVGRAFQKTLNIWKPEDEARAQVDGFPGANTIALLNRTVVLDEWGSAYLEMVKAMVYKRIESYTRIVQRDERKSGFLWGWIKRALRPLDQMIALCDLTPWQIGDAPPGEPPLA